MQGFLIYRALLIVLIYAFLAVALYIIWREFSHNAKKTDDSPETAVILLTKDETSGVSTHQLRPVTAIGRASDNHIIIEDPFASTHHAVIVWRDRQWWLEDLESHNGTRLNDDVMTEPTILASGDVIHIGETELKFEMRQV